MHYINNIFDKIIYSSMFIIAILSIYYIYHKNSLKTFQVVTIYAEGKPTKKKPINPGGIKFNDIDKSVYNFVSSSHKNLQNIKKNNSLEQKKIHNQNVNMRILTEELADIFEYSTDKNNDDLQKNITHYNNHNLDKLLNIQIFSDQDSRFKLLKKENTNTVSTELTNQNLSYSKNDFKLNNLNNYTLQLHIAKTSKQVEEERMRIFEVYKGIVDDIPYFINQKSIDNNGVIYQLNLGSFASFSKASVVCKKLIKRHQSCIIKKIKNL